jgi:hypothetical protein
MPASDTDNLIQHAQSLVTGVTLNVMERPGTGTPVICLHLGLLAVLFTARCAGSRLVRG